ncbi:MAG: ABC transporter permease [Thermoleophilaceae bacterium]
MTKLALRGLAARKLRAALTAVAVVLGIGLVAGTYVVTDTINASFDDIFRTANEGSDVIVKTEEAVESDTETVPPMPASVLEQVSAVDGVASAAGAIFDTVSIFDEDGERIGTTGAPSFVASTAPEPFSTFDYTEGAAPASDDEMAVLEATADRDGFEIGDSIQVAGRTGTSEYRVSGIARFGEVSSFGGASLVVATLAEAQRLVDKEGEFDAVSAAAEDGVTPEELAQRIDAELPPGIAVRTGEEDAAQQSTDIEDDLGFLQTALLVFAGIALFVGAFTIFNTFSITVAQRMREFAMLRTLGASRRQLLVAVVVEALLIGVAASAVGLLAGIGLAPALNGLLSAFGLDLPSTQTVVESRTVIVSLVVGTVITLLAALVPALRATRVSPMAALREGAAPSGGHRRRGVTALAVVLLGAGVVLICVGLFGGGGDDATVLSLLGGGAALIFLGTALASPRLVRPIASGVGRPIERLRGVTGRIARENAVRNPGRTAVTAAALMIGLALVTFVTVFAAGARNSVDEIISQQFAGDLLIQNTDGFSPIPGPVAETAAQVPGVELVAPTRTSEGRLVGGEDETIRPTGVDPGPFAQLFQLDWVDGSDDDLRGLGAREAVLDSEWADDEGIEVGDEFTVLTPRGTEVTYTAAATFDNPDLTGEFVIPEGTLRTDYGEDRAAIILVGVTPGADRDAVQDRLNEVLAAQFPVAEALDQEGVKDRISESVNQVLGLIYVLLALAIIVSLFGIVNTLALSIHERTREIGMLRAIGMSVQQMRRVVRYEAVITALIGAVLGTVIGLFFGWIVMQPLADDGFSFTLPVGTILIMLAIATVAGVIAAIGPARRATRLDVLDALAYE